MTPAVNPLLWLFSDESRFKNWYDVLTSRFYFDKSSLSLPEMKICGLVGVNRHVSRPELRSWPSPCLIPPCRNSLCVFSLSLRGAAEAAFHLGIGLPVAKVDGTPYRGR